MRKHRHLTIAAVLFLFATRAGAVGLGEISVGSHLGEPFHAEVVLALDKGERVSNLSVDPASPADYRMLDVHRDQALNAIRAETIRDGRGSRVVLSSRHPVDIPYFTLVLKVRYDRATHYRRYPVFLDVSRTARPAKTVSARDMNEEPAAPMMVEDSVTGEKVTNTASPVFRPFDDWARTSRYGPIVYGDSIYTIADRLRVDERYTIRQIMVALFEKNRTRFAEENLNLPLYGTYLDAPMAEEVERLTYEQALATVQDHDSRFRELMQQPRYAAVAEAQRNRYSRRVRDAEAIKADRAASGMAATPVSE
ncbi:MAG: FimV/HubP family polar landmark protein [Mariprofundaceae bacterium]|nr:FimV/HubP family polar landmark protein [Mariprofundaceae bacterium]